VFQILSFIMAGIVTIAFPPAAIITIPAMIIWATSTRRKVREAQRVRQVFVDHMDERTRHQALARW
jgi:hypothetical protein